MKLNGNNSGNRIRGNGNVIGSGNVVQTLTQEHHHHHKTNNSTDPNKGDDVIGAAVGLFIVAVGVGWLYVKNAEWVYHYIKLASLVAGLPSLITLAYLLINRSDEVRGTVAALYGVLLSSCVFGLAMYGQTMLDPRIIELSQQSSTPIQFWNGLNSYGHNIVVGCMVGAIFVGVAAIFALFMGVFIALYAFGDGDTEGNGFLRLVNPFRPVRGGIISGFALAFGWFFESGYALQIFSSFSGQAA